MAKALADSVVKKFAPSQTTVVETLANNKNFEGVMPLAMNTSVAAKLSNNDSVSAIGKEND